MVPFSRILTTLLIYRHTTMSLLVYSVSMALYLVLPSDASWYRLTVVGIAGVSVLVHSLIAWRLQKVFQQSADPILYISAVVFGLTTIVFVPTLWEGALVAMLTAGILLLSTVSPRVAQFSVLFVHKGWRRLYGIAWLSVVYFFLTTMYGLYLFLASFPWLAMVACGALGLVGATISVVRLYVSDTVRVHRSMYAVVFFVFAEMLTVSLLLPFGVFSFGLLLTWVWYLVTLLCRFAVTERGIIWGEQRRYLFVHGILLACVVLSFLRWT